MAMLTVENINVYYGVIHALKDISFQVNEGEIVALIRRKRCRQNHHPADCQRHAERKVRFDPISGSGDFQNAGAQNREAGNFPRPRRTPDVLQSDGFGKPENGRLHQKRTSRKSIIPWKWFMCGFPA